MRWQIRTEYATTSLNESPSEKEGKYGQDTYDRLNAKGLNESPSEKEGKSHRQSNLRPHRRSLNESPSEKEGKSGNLLEPAVADWPQ